MSGRPPCAQPGAQRADEQQPIHRFDEYRTFREIERPPHGGAHCHRSLLAITRRSGGQIAAATERGVALLLLIRKGGHRLVDPQVSSGRTRERGHPSILPERAVKAM